jgi:hypothetical protein
MRIMLNFSFKHFNSADFDLNDNDIYDNHNDLFGDKELDEIAAFVIGRKINHILHNSNQLKDRITHILTEKRAVIAQKMAINNPKSELIINQMLQHLLGGILENH